MTEGGSKVADSEPDYSRVEQLFGSVGLVMHLAAFALPIALVLYLASGRWVWASPLELLALVAVGVIWAVVLVSIEPLFRQLASGVE